MGLPGRGEAAGDSVARREPVCAAPRSRIEGHIGKSEGAQRDYAAMPLGGDGLGEALREARACAVGLISSRPGDDCVRPYGAVEFQDSAPFLVRSSSTGDPVKQVFVSLYGGVARCAEYVTQQGFDALVFDTCHSPLNDICKTGVPRNIHKSIPTLSAVCVGVELVCSTWGLARRAQAWSSFPSAVRDRNRYIFGLPGAVGHDAVALKNGSRQFYHAI